VASQVDRGDAVTGTGEHVADAVPQPRVRRQPVHEHERRVTATRPHPDVQTDAAGSLDAPLVDDGGGPYRRVVS
jgi:hypothetical protein